jgi:cytochrome c553
MTARVDRKEQAVATRLRRRAPVIGWMLAGLLVGPGAAVWAPSAAAADSTDGAYVWNAMQGEKLVALGTKGDAARGEITFEICQGCHRAHALGRPDGSYPRLAGQHITVLIKQMTDVRAGRRKNEKMLPFIDKHVTSPQDIADVAAYLTQLPSPPGNGQGPGTDLARGEGIYAAQCASPVRDRDGLDGGEALQPLEGLLAAVARVLHAAEGQFDAAAGAVVVDEDLAGVDAVRHTQRAAAVARPDRGGQAVGRAVGQRRGFVLAVEGEGRQHRAEDLVLRHLVRGGTLSSRGGK